MFIEKKDLQQSFGYSTDLAPGRPYLNVPNAGGYSFYFSQATIADKKTIMWHVKRSPEAIGILRAIATDIITKISFKSIQKPKSAKGGRPVSQDAHKDKEDKAHEFSRKHFLKQTLTDAVMDWLLGEAFLWKGGLDEEQESKLRMAVYKEASERGFQLTEAEFKEMLDEDPDTKKKLVHIASTTMKVLVNEEGTGVSKFRQEVNARYRVWPAKQIIHAKYMTLDGKPNGYSPMEASIPLLKTLGMITDYHGHFFDSGGTPDIIFNFEELSSNDPALNKWQQTIEDWANNKRRSHLVMGSKLKIERVNEMNKDMEFRLLSIYYTGRIAFAFGMPLEKFQQILGGEISSSTGSSDLGNADYQRNTANAQEYWENLLSTQFFNEEFEVDMCLARGFLQDQVRELTVQQSKVTVVQGIMQMDLIKEENTADFINSYFPDIPRDWINPTPARDWVAKGNADQMSKDEVQKGDAQKGYASQKKSQQKPQSRNSPPSGT